MWELPIPAVKTGPSPQLVKILSRRRVGSKKRGPWFILPLQASSVFNADSLERYWIVKLGASLNTRDLPKSCRRYQLMLGARVADRIQPEQLMSVSQGIISQRRCTVPIREQLQALSQARAKLPGPLRSQLYQAVYKHVRDTLHITLPACVPLRIPSILVDEPRPLNQIMDSFLHSLPPPLPLRQYLVNATQVSFVRAPTVSQLLCQRRITTSLDEAKDKGSRDCDCAALAAQWGCPLVDGHVVARAPWLLHKMFGKQAPILLQNADDTTIPSWSETAEPVIKSLRSIRIRLLPDTFDLDTAGPALYSCVITKLNGMRCSRAWCGTPPIWLLLIWLEPGMSHVTWVHYDATMCLACPVCSVLLVWHFLRFGLFVL